MPVTFFGIITLVLRWPVLKLRETRDVLLAREDSSVGYRSETYVEALNLYPNHGTEEHYLGLESYFVKSIFTL